MTESYRIGRDLGRGPLRPSFTLNYSDTGAVTLSDEDPDHGPSHADRKLILDHLALPQYVVFEQESDDKIMLVRKQVSPGTLVHFQTAVAMMPKPFGRMPIPVKGA